MSLSKLSSSNTDVTEIKQTVEALRKAHELSKRIIEDGPVAITKVDRDGEIVFANHQAEQLFGLEKSNIQGRRYNEPAWQITAVDGSPYPDEELPFYRVMATGRAVYDVQHAIIRANRSRCILSINAAPLHDAQGRIDSIVFAIQDITERKTAEHALRESESRVRRKLNVLLDPEGDIETLNLNEVVDCDEIQSLMNDFYALTGIGVGITDLDGTVLVKTGWQDICVKYHRVHPETAKFCQESDTVLTSGVEPGTFKIYKCKNNMWDIVTPIVIGGKKVGNLFLGQFFFDDETPDIATFREQAIRYGFDEDAYLKAYHAIPRWSRKTVDQVMTFYCNLIGMISRLCYAQIKLARTTEALNAANTKLNLAMQAAGQSFWEWNLISDTVHFDDGALEMLGYCRGDIQGPMKTGTWWMDQVHADDKTCMVERFKRYLSGKEKNYHCEFRLKDKSGSYLWVSSSAKVISKDPAGNPEVLVGIHQDISERKRIEQRMASLSAVVENSDDIVVVKDLNLRVVATNPAFAKAAGHATVDTMIGKTDAEIFGVTPDTEPIRAYMEDERRTQTLPPGEHILREEAVLTPDGGVRTVLTKKYPIYDQSGNLVGTGNISTDITKRKQAEERQKNLATELEEILDSLPDAVVYADTDRRIKKINPSFTRIFGYSRDEVLGKTTRIIYRNDDEYLEQGRKRYNPKASQIWEPYEIHHVRKDGTEFISETVGTPVRDAHGKIVGLLGLVRDITEKKQREAEYEKLQAQFRQAQKMEAVGRLAGGVAHDFNNMLGIIIGHADMILEELDPDQPFHANLTEIRKAGERSADLTRQLLAFARKQTVAPKVIDINKTVEGMLKMLHRLIGEDIEMTWIPGEKVWPVKIDPAQVDQILANLCVNARDAITNVGRVTIETGNTVFDEAYCRVHAHFEPGKYVMLAVSDTGCGMDAETMSHLFEPFFTTKEQGKGTGLGLATVYGVVKQNKCFINVYSEPGQGTTVKMYLPRHAVKAETMQPRLQTVERGSETILLVEDEPAILKMTTIMLERLGYTVLPAPTPGEAIRLATENAGDIHLLLTDVVMPEMNGRDLAKNLLSLYPDLKRLFMSGYTANVIAHHGVLDEGVQFIQKPFSTQKLASKVREVLD
jgi:PAS domain S-box-containing protein